MIDLRLNICSATRAQSAYLALLELKSVESKIEEIQANHKNG